MSNAKQTGLYLAAFILLFLLLAGPVGTCTAEPRGLFNLGAKTAGGGLAWTDVIVFHDYRIQQHAVVGHYRLLDGNNYRLTYGSLENCLGELEGIKRDKNLAGMPKEVTIVLHGLGGNRHFMDELAEYVEKNTQTKVLNIGYASTMGGVDAHAQALQTVLRHLDGVEKVNFVAHSMGNLVIRHCLYDLQQLPEDQKLRIEFGRYVMISPPNHGAEMADKFADSKAAQLFGGDAVQQLAPGRGWSDLEKHLVTPDFEFAIIAGGVGDGGGYLAAIPGEDDGLLSLETTKLDGASDFALVKGIHQLLPKNEQVQEYVVRFLQRGYLVAPNAMQPLGRVSARAAGHGSR